MSSTKLMRLMFNMHSHLYTSIFKRHSNTLKCFTARACAKRFFTSLSPKPLKLLYNTRWPWDQNRWNSFALRRRPCRRSCSRRHSSSSFGLKPGRRGSHSSHLAAAVGELARWAAAHPCSGSASGTVAAEWSGARPDRDRMTQ